MVSLIAKMGIFNFFSNNMHIFGLAAERSATSSIQEAREAMCNVACDIIKATMSNNSSNRGGGSLLVPSSLRLLPLYMLSMIKSVGEKYFGYVVLRFVFFFRRHLELLVEQELMIVHAI